MTKTAFLFPGQGAQSVGMGRQLAEQLPAARALYDRASQLLGYDLAEICFEDPEDELDSTVYSQPALFVTSLAALEMLRQKSPDVVEQCQAAAGLSLGEYTALVFAGVMDFEAGLKVVQRRGEAMQAASDATPSGMVSILGLDRAKVEQLCEQVRQTGEVLQPANFLCPANIAVSGSKEACERIADAAVAAGAMKVVPLAVAGAFHTPIMGSVVDRLAAVLADVPMAKPRIPVISNVDARSHDDPEEIRQLLVKQVVSPVLWEDSLRHLLGDGFDSFYEVGPGRVLKGLLRRLDRKVTCENVMD
ncbi:MAG: ACP S-malonyltransferase [Planctomycetota bacterium]|nr:ACP S-malonyltransferase [Planctomycetota bacterium]